MVLREAGQVFRLNLEDGPLVHHARRDGAFLNEVA
jgi:hypothetical protein